jgi:AraC-like DNA-binding protein
MPTRDRWVGRLFLRPGRLLYAGLVGPTEPHVHHAFQIVRGVSGPVTVVDTEGSSLPVLAAVIPPDTRHATVGTAYAWMLYVDPDDAVGRRLRSSAVSGTSARSWMDLGTPLQDIGAPLPESWPEADALEGEVFGALGLPTARPRPRHPAVLRALRAIDEGLASDVSVPTVAALAGLSPGRLSHVFSEELGIPVRRYVLWRRLMRAAREVQHGASWTEAAHAGGFTDSSHLTRTFHTMFGLAPTAVYRDVQWLLPPGSAQDSAEASTAAALSDP